MSIFSSVYNSIVNAAHNRYDKKLLEGLSRLDVKLKAEPRFQKVAGQYFTTKRMIDKLTEYFIWYIGDENIIRQYFHTNTSGYVISEDVNLNQFWKKAPEDYVMVHTGLPGVFSSKMAKITLGQGYEIDVEVYKKDENGIVTETIDEKESGRIKAMLTDTLFPKMQFHQKLMAGAHDESWSGHIAYKLAYDPSVTPYPILEEGDRRFFEIIKERGHTTAIIFHQWYAKDGSAGSKKYRLDEVYSTCRRAEQIAYYNQFKVNKDNVSSSVEIGDAVIDYILYDVTDETHEKVVPFANWKAACPELTANILQEAFSFPKLKRMLAFEKANKLPNRDEPGSHYGQSDYAGCTGSFHITDELYSENAREVRDNKSMQAIPEDWLPKDDEGRRLKRDPFRTNIVVSKSDIDQQQGTHQNFETTQILDKTESIKLKWQLELGNICTVMGISPTSIGIAGFESIAASEKSQQEREKATIDTRKDKLELWEPFINDILLGTLEFNTWLQENMDVKQPGLDDMNIDFANCNIRVQFPDYVKSNTNERINTWGAAKNFGLADTKSAVEQVWAPLGKTQKEIEQIADLIKLERNLSIDNPDALSMNTLLGGENQQ